MDLRHYLGVLLQVRRPLKTYSLIVIKTRLRNRMREKSLSHLMKISIESPEKVSDSNFENVVDVWKNRREVV